MHVMLDLETMGNSSTAAIVAIGAVVFNEEGFPTPAREFYATVDLESSVREGMSVDASTVYWWLQQSEEARKALLAPDKYSLPSALGAFARFIRECPEYTKDREVCVWGNGATFDNVILSNAYKLCEMQRPWSYQGDRCYRTVRNLAPRITVESVGVAHNALDDAKYQANVLIAIARELNIVLK